MTIATWETTENGAAHHARAEALVRGWLIVVAVFVFAMIVVGGATRLTDSGLSITEWLPILGVIPPLTDADWQIAFDKYREIPEYQLQNRGMSLAAFKVIYWWEWAHRALGRLVGVVFFVPFAAFLAMRVLSARLAWRLLLIFALGGLQGAIGWWMVASGLVDRVDVAPYRLATHLTLACVILVLTVATAATLITNEERHVDLLARHWRRDRALSWSAAALVLLGLVQTFLGGLVAGNDAGLVFNTWPSMNGRFLPDGFMALDPWWRSLFEEHGTVQFVHRVGAYVLLAAAALHVVQAWASPYRAGALAVLAIVLAQAAIGIWTLILAVPMWLGLLHQGGIAVVLAVMVAHHAHVSRTAATV